LSINAPADFDKLVLELIGDPELRVDAVRASARFDDPAFTEAILSRWNDLKDGERYESITVMAQRPQSARRLVDAVNKGTIDRSSVPVQTIRQILGYGDAELSTRIAERWPELRAVAPDRRKRIDELKRQLHGGRIASADRSNGRAIYAKTCANCHKLFGEGGQIGPELTGSQRTNIDYLLENMVDPSAQLADNYRMSIISMNDGRVIQGLVGAKRDKTIEVTTATEKLTLSNDDVESIKPTKLSLMPEGQLDLMKPDEIRDLIAYLMSARQVSLPSPAK
jgi:putative heme-binding domain-containing protein